MEIYICLQCIKASVLVFTYRHSTLCQAWSRFSSPAYKNTMRRLRLTISSLAFTLALSSTVAFAAPRAIVSVPKAAVVVNVLEDALNIRSASCKIRGACSVLSPPDTCCGACILIDSTIVSQDACSQLEEVLTPNVCEYFWSTFYLYRGTACPPLPYRALR